MSQTQALTWENRLGEANTQWASRPADQSYLSLEELHAAVVKRTERAREAKGVSYADLRVQADEGELLLVGKSNVPAGFTNWSFGQLCSRVAAPVGWMERLPATLAAQNLNWALAKRGADLSECKLLLDQNGHATVRAFTGPNYSRIWDRDITKRLMGLGAKGWAPGPVTELPQGGKTRGLYASDRDMWALVVDNERRVFETAPGGGLSRGAIFSNGECGDRKFRMLTFLYEWICANHNIWGVQDVKEVEVTHVGDAAGKAWTGYKVALEQWQNASAKDDEARIKRAMAYQIAGTKDEVLDAIFAKGFPGLTRKVLEAGYEAAERHVDWYGSPRTAWGLRGGVTEVAREIPWADARVEVERGAQRVVEMAF